MMDKNLSTQALQDAPNLMGLGPCGKPCDQDCDEPCDDKPQTAHAGWAKWMNSSLFNALDVCFDDVYSEPKKILIVGGCRQMDLAQHIALLLPAADIHLVDPDEAWVERAKEEICCRFKFVSAPLDALPYEQDEFDFTIAHNALVLPQSSWMNSISELARVTRSNLFFSTHRPILWKIANRFEGFRQAVQSLKLEVPEHLPDAVELADQLTRFSKIKTRLMPFPWTVYMTQVKPKWEERLVLAS